MRPSRFDNDSPQVGIAGFGNPAALDAIAAGVFARNQTAVADQLSPSSETMLAAVI